MSKRNKVISVELTDKQQKQFDEGCGHLKALYGEVGSLTWKISPTGIGEGIVVYSHNAKIEFDLTDVSNW